MVKPGRVVLVAGHIGVGHVYSHSGFFQDDSLGFSSAVALLRDFFDFDTTVRRAAVDSLRTVCVETGDGGVGCASPRRGLTVFEAEMLRRLEGADASLPHLETLRIFGRVYGNGCLEVPVAVEYALSAAVLDTLARRVRGFVLRRNEETGDVIGGVRVDLEGGALAVVISVNGSVYGIGPNENLEGNVPLGAKGEVMKELEALVAPTIILEGKAFVPGLSERVRWTSILLRYNRDYDNIAVAEVIRSVLEERKLDYVEVDSAFPRFDGSMERAKRSLVESLREEILKLERSRGAREKVAAAASLAKIVCEDIGGVIFMDDDLCELVGACGVVPGTGAVVSVVVGSDYIRRSGVPYATRDDAEVLADVALESAKRSIVDYDKIMEVLRSRYRAPVGSA